MMGLFYRVERREGRKGSELLPLELPQIQPFLPLLLVV